MFQAKRLVLIDALIEKDSGQFRTLFLILVGSLLLTVSAKVQVPFYPVPMTLQTLVVLLIGVAFGWRMGSATVLAYRGHYSSALIRFLPISLRATTGSCPTSYRLRAN